MKRIFCLFMLAFTVTSISAKALLMHDMQAQTAKLMAVRLSALSDDTVSMVRLSDYQRADRLLAQDAVVIALGANVFQWLCQQSSSIHVIGLLMGQEEYLTLSQACRVSHTAVLAGADLSLRLAILKQLLPNERRLGLIYSESIQIDQANFQRTASEYGFEFIFRQTTPDKATILRTTNDLLSQTNILFSLIDSALYDSAVAQDMLRLIFRQRKIMVGPSENFVKAGALYTLYSDFDTQLQAALSLIDQYNFDPRVWPRAFYPQPIRIVFNPFLVRSLGISIPSSRYIETYFGVCADSGCEESTH